MIIVYEKWLVFVYVDSFMYQSVNLSWKIVIQNPGCVSVCFCCGHKMIYGYNFVTPLSWSSVT